MRVRFLEFASVVGGWAIGMIAVAAIAEFWWMPNYIAPPQTRTRCTWPTPDPDQIRMPTPEELGIPPMELVP